jgi:hypothetical protein
MTIQFYFNTQDYDSTKFLGHCMTSLSAPAVAGLVIPYRNAVYDQGQPGSLFRIVVTELAFAVFAVAALVESVVRVVLTVLFGSISLSLSCSDWSVKTFAIAGFWYNLLGSYVCVQNALTCLAALFMNFYKGYAPLEYAEILPCFEECNQALNMGYNPNDVITLPGDLRNPRYIAFVETCKQKIREIPADGFRSALPPERRDALAILTLQVKINDVDSGVPAVSMVVNDYQQLERELPRAKGNLIARLEGWHNPFRILEMAMIPRTVEIDCRLTNSEGGGTAFWTATLHRSGDIGTTSGYRR